MFKMESKGMRLTECQGMKHEEEAEGGGGHMPLMATSCLQPLYFHSASWLSGGEQYPLSWAPHHPLRLKGNGARAHGLCLPKSGAQTDLSPLSS